MTDDYFPSLVASYRTPDGQYCEAVCDFSEAGIYFANEYAQDWFLSRLPDGSVIHRVTVQWNHRQETPETFAILATSGRSNSAKPLN